MDAQKDQPVAQPAAKPEEHSLLSDVYNWGATQVSNATHWVTEHPGEAAVATIAAAGTALLAAKKLPLLAIGAGGAAVLSLAGCDSADPDEEAKAYENPQQCAADGNDLAACTTKFEEAKKEHLQIAPKFDTKEKCEEETGTSCAVAPDGATGPIDGSSTAATPTDTTNTNGTTTHSSGGHSFFMPYMFGYMMGSNNNSYYAGRPLYGAPGSSIGRPNFVTPEGHSVGSTTGRVTVPHSSISEGGHSTTSGSRGGFGSAGRYGGGYGG